jgi:hypothetical protein
MEQTEWEFLLRLKVNMNLESVPNEPGLYKLAFSSESKNYIYIGQAGSLRRRIDEYANSPKEGLKSEHLFHDLLKIAGGADLFVAHIGLKDQNTRCAFEQEAIVSTQRQGLMCFNKKGFPVDNAMRRIMLKSEEMMLTNRLERVRTKLTALNMT